MPLEDALARVPGLAGYLGQEQFTQRQNAGTLQNATTAQTLQEHFTKAQRERQARDALSQLGPDAGPEAISRAIMPFMGAEGAMRHADTQARIASAREQALARLAQQASQFDRKQLTAEQRLKLDTWYKNQAAAIAQGRAAYDLPPDVYQPPAAPQQPQGVEFNVEGVRGTAPDEATALAIGRRLQGLPAASQGAPAQPAATPAAPAPAEAPVAAPEQLSGPEPTVPAPAAPVQGAPVARGEVPPPQGAPVARVGDLPSPPPELEAAWAKLGRRDADKARAKWTADAIKGQVGRASDTVVNAVAEGRQPLPSGFALRSPYWQDVIERVNKINPQFDAGVYGARAAARRTFASGPEARNVTALNTVIGHLGTLDEMATALGNNDIRVVNSVLNRLATETGDPRIQNFDTAKQAVAEETMRVFRQVGASELEAKQWGERISSSGSPSQLRGVISTLGQLLESRVEAIGQQYERTVTQSGNPAKIDPANQEKLDRLKSGGNDRQVQVGGKTYTFPTPAAANEFRRKAGIQ